MSYNEIRRKLLEILASGEAYNIPYLARILNVDRANLHKIIKPLIEKGIIEKYKADGLSWVRLKYKSLYHRAKREVDLIIRKRVSQTINTPECREHVLRAKRINPFKFEAQKILANTNMLDNNLWITLNRLFNDYMFDISRRAIILKHKVNDNWLFIPYNTRFNRSYLKRLILKFNKVFNNANRFSYGVWLTLTIDPKRYRNLIEMRYELQKAWNRFMSYLRKKFGFRPLYIRVIEFTKSGLIHYHVILFGIKRIADKKTELTPYLEKIGFGKINFLYVIVNRNGKWIPFKLLRANNCDGGGLPSNLRAYLSKYLTKAFSSINFENGVAQVDEDNINPIVLYWALNCRFFTCSKSLDVHIENVTRTYEWEFWGSGYVDIPDMLPYHSLDPPWAYHIPYTFPPLYMIGIT